MHENQVSQQVIGAAIEVHRTLGGPGFLESVYEEALVWELMSRGMQVERQKHVPILYKGKVLATPLRLDLIVNNIVLVECKSVVEFNPVFEVQALAYLRLTGLRLALVINFGEATVKNGLHRVVNGMDQ